MDVPVQLYPMPSSGATPHSERVVYLECEGERLIGVISEGVRGIGIVIVVGGPQYRVGSHRMFVKIAREFAGLGHPVLRFDVRGMGDSIAECGSFESIGTDISSAIDCIQREASINQVMLLGLCDGASAVCMYAFKDPRVTKISLINPWVRTESSTSHVMLNRYYRKRLVQPHFWKQLFSGQVRVGQSIMDFLRELMLARRADYSETGNFIDRMLSGLSRFSGAVYIGLSGQDIVAAEFERLSETQPWLGALQRESTRVDHFAEADHTFSEMTQLKLLIDSIVPFLSNDDEIG